jgi:hypothetical protein
MNTDLLISLRRTLVPIVVGVVSGSFLSAHVDLASVETVVSGFISAVYYAALRLVEARIPGAGVLLGARRQPVYAEPEVV